MNGQAAYAPNYTAPTADTNGWKLRHQYAMASPRPSEWIGLAITAWVEMARHHRDEYGRGIGQDGFAADPWAAIGANLHDLLNMDIGRLDCASLSAVIVDTLEAEGYDFDMREWREGGAK